MYINCAQTRTRIRIEPTTVVIGSYSTLNVKYANNILNKMHPLIISQI